MAVTTEPMDRRENGHTDLVGGGEGSHLLCGSAKPEVSPVRPARKRHTKSNGVSPSPSVEEAPSSEDTLKPEDAKRPYDIHIPYKSKWRYPDLAAQMFIHGGAVYGLYLLLTRASLITYLWVFVHIYTSAVGVTAGAHRLWSHKAYQANLPLRVFLAAVFTMSGQRDIYMWVLDHRVHHRFTETDADPHDARRGFLFAHVGWLVLTPHPAVEKERKLVDMSDLENDAVVVWHRRLYVPLFALFCIALPVGVPYYFWNETLWVAFWVCFNFRFSAILNLAFLVNSAAHMYGNRPYDMNIRSRENPTLSAFVIGEGWHNYHHVFPWDYRAGELGQGRLNITTDFIDLMARIGWVKNRRKASPDMIINRAVSRGDGTARHDAHNLAAVAAS